MDTTLKVIFEHNRLNTAVYFLEYCEQHNVKCSTLNNDGLRYSVNVPYRDIAHLSRYLVADAAKHVQQLIFLERINESMLLALTQSIPIAENITC